MVLDTSFEFLTPIMKETNKIIDIDYVADQAYVPILKSISTLQFMFADKLQKLRYLINPLARAALEKSEEFFSDFLFIYEQESDFFV